MPQEDITKIRRSEIAHSLHQAINRAACRNTINGEARVTNVWLIHHGTKARPLLEEVKPVAPYIGGKRNLAKRLVARIEQAKATIQRNARACIPAL